MFKWIKKIKKNSKANFTTGIIIGIFITASGVYASTLINAKDVTYDNSTFDAPSTNVQDVLEDLYNKANDLLENEPRYAFGMPNRSSSLDFQEVISSTGSRAIVRKLGNQLSACIYRNEQLFCLKAGEKNWDANVSVLNETVFPNSTCSPVTNVGSSEEKFIACRDHTSDQSFECEAYSTGKVLCWDGLTGKRCTVKDDDAGCHEGW